ncbi:hypothetical protein ACQ4LE_001144 [Meloidogyne hapla]
MISNQRKHKNFNSKFHLYWGLNSMIFNNACHVGVDKIQEVLKEKVNHEYTQQLQLIEDSVTSVVSRTSATNALYMHYTNSTSSSFQQQTQSSNFSLPELLPTTISNFIQIESNVNQNDSIEVFPIHLPVTYNSEQQQQQFFNNESPDNNISRVTAPNKTQSLTAEQKDALIDVIRQRPVIWNCSLPDYKNTENRENAFAEVAELFSDDNYKYIGSEIQHEWENLRDIFSAILKRIESGGSSENISWRYWHKLQFIANLVNLKKSENQQTNNDIKSRKITGKIFLNAEKDEALISAVRDRPVIWDCSHPNFKNIQKRSSAYAEVAELLSDDTFKYSGIKINIVWQRLRKNFNSISKKVTSNGGADDTVTWRYWKNLQFIAHNNLTKSNITIQELDRIPRPTFTRPNSKKSGTAKNQTKSVNEHNYECCLFTTEQREAFINAIRERSIIWGYSPCTFKDFQERRAAFIEVAEIISNEKSKYSGPEMQYMWNLLRNTFLKNLRKVIANGGDYSKITWRYWKNLQFIEDYERTRMNVPKTNPTPYLSIISNNSKKANENEEEPIESPSTSYKHNQVLHKENESITNLNSVTIDLSSLAIFPDEEEKGFKKLNGYISVKTRNSTSFPINCATNFDSSDNQHISQIDKWKKISRYFTNCAQKDICDPFGIFDANEDNICFSCLEIRDNLREKSILMWDAEQLEQKLCDYAYFHAIKIFNPNAEYQFANTKSKHPYFLAYENIRQQIKIILKNISSVFNFPSEIQSAARRTFMTQTRNTQQTLKISPYCKICCERITFSTYILTFEGNKYKNNFELFENGDSKPNNFLVCHRHARLFSVYYRLLHMDWNIHWNCYLRISQIQKRLPNLNASNVINAVDPQIFLDISKEYFSLFKVLDELVYLKNNRHVVCGISDSLIEGFHSWDKIKVFIKDIGILKRIEEEK